jgi:hypothetical protein
MAHHASGFRDTATATKMNLLAGKDTAMSRRRSAKGFSGSRHIADARAHSRQPEVIELKQLVSDIRVRLSRLSEAYGESMSFQLKQHYARPRLYRSPARVEAEALYHMVQAGRDSVDNVRALIAVPPNLEVYVQDLNFPNPGEQKKLLASLKFRKQVMKEFDELVVGERLAAVAVGTGSGNS